MKSLILGLLLMSFASLTQAKSETRCGWIQNPTPANFWLTDADGTWTMGTQGHYQALGLDLLEYPADDQYVDTNGSYGYFCGCVTGIMDNETKVVLSIKSSKAKLLKDCLKDPNLSL